MDQQMKVEKEDTTLSPQDQDMLAWLTNEIRTETERLRAIEAEIKEWKEKIKQAEEQEQKIRQRLIEDQNVLARFRAQRGLPPDEIHAPLTQATEVPRPKPSRADLLYKILKEHGKPMTPRMLEERLREMGADLPLKADPVNAVTSALCKDKSGRFTRYGKSGKMTLWGLTEWRTIQNQANKEDSMKSEVFTFPEGG